MSQKSIEAKIIEKKGDKTVLEINKQQVNVASNCLPDSASQGKTLKLYFLNPEEAVTSDKKLAKVILEEILNGK